MDMIPAPRLALPGKPPSGPVGPANRLTRRQKAAIVVQFLLRDGGDVALTALPQDLQALLTQEMGSMRYVDRDTLNTVIEEFTQELDAVGLTFGDGISGALDQLEGRISPQTARRLRKEAGVRQTGDPWARVGSVPPEKLAELISAESTEVAAVVLSKIDVPTAASVMALLSPEKARRVAYAVSMTSKVTPDAVDRIGLSLAAELDAVPPTAFETPPVARVGAILNVAKTATREDVLRGLDETDEEFARDVRKAIFTFANIAVRVAAVDVPKILRDVPQDDLSRALAYAKSLGDDEVKSVNFLVENTSKRMSEMLVEEIDEIGTVPEEEGEAAVGLVIAAIRRLADAKEIQLVNDAPES